MIKAAYLIVLFLSVNKAWPQDLIEQPQLSKFAPGHCSIMRLSNETKLECPNVINFKEPGTCGGILMESNGCMLYDSGTYSQVDRSGVGKGIPSKEDLALKWRLEAEMWPYSPDSPWCSSDINATQGAFMGASSAPLKETDIVDDAKFQGPDSEFVTKTCRLLPLNQPALLKGFGGKRLLWIGDSHIRNMFTALIFATRQSAYVAEQHGFHAAYHYSVGPEADHFSIFSRESVEGVRLPTLIGDQHEVLNVKENPFTPCEDLNLGSPCVDLVFVWAPLFVEQVAIIKPFLDLVKPQVVLTSVSSWEKVRVTDSAWEHVWQGVFKSPGELESWGFVMWPWGNKRGDEREEHMRKFMLNVPETIRTYFLNMFQIHRHIKSSQLDNFWHDICTVRDNWPNAAYKLETPENCTGTISRALVRVALTLGRPIDPDEKKDEAIPKVMDSSFHEEKISPSPTVINNDVSESKVQALVDQLVVVKKLDEVLDTPGLPDVHRYLLEKLKDSLNTS